MIEWIIEKYFQVRIFLEYHMLTKAKRDRRKVNKPAPLVAEFLAQVQALQPSPVATIHVGAFMSTRFQTSDLFNMPSLNEQMYADYSISTSVQMC